ncbi:MAG: exopolysaccharide biosynthesis polyprenyl glycosylphosphotransferase [Oscillospiraceae bacterium]|nr:exopolysaccharide biosynthesis polyprenyl glycosylphosphotransferase [Oscillospiraceae bacterium]
MRNCLKGSVIRVSKFLHYLLTIGSFAGYCWFARPTEGMAQFAAAVLIYAVIFLFSVRTYSAYNIGMSRVHMLVYSQTLCDLLTAAVLYATQTLLRGGFFSPLPLLGLLALQLLLNCLWALGTNALYFGLNKPKRTVIIYRSETDLRRLDELYLHHQKFQVTRTIACTSSEIHPLLKELEGFEAVFVTGIDASLRNGIAKYCVEKNIRCYITPRVGDVLMMGSKHQELFSVPVFRVMRAEPQLEYLMVKRLFDILCSLLGIILLSPFMLLTALMIKLYDRGPVIYKQVRLTKDGREFKILKFRSMRVDAEKDGVARLSTANDDRITPVGKFIRAIRFDELPQLFNILKGDMTIVGPRPERPEIARQYEQQTPAFALRLQVKAGLTGLAQVYGKYNTDPYDKLRMDLMYINRMSLLYDIQLMLATVKVLFMKESTSGIADGQTTASIEATQEEKAKEYAVK